MASVHLKRRRQTQSLLKCQRAEWKRQLRAHCSPPGNKRQKDAQSSVSSWRYVNLLEQGSPVGNLGQIILQAPSALPLTANVFSASFVVTASVCSATRSLTKYLNSYVLIVPSLKYVTVLLLDVCQQHVKILKSKKYIYTYVNVI